MQDGWLIDYWSTVQWGKISWVAVLCTRSKIHLVFSLRCSKATPMECWSAVKGYGWLIMCSLLCNKTRAIECCRLCASSMIDWLLIYYQARGKLALVWYGGRHDWSIVDLVCREVWLNVSMLWKASWLTFCARRHGHDWFRFWSIVQEAWLINCWPSEQGSINDGDIAYTLQGDMTD